MANYPSSIFTFTTVNNGDTTDASQIDNPVAEIIAVETGLLNGFQHDLFPLSDGGQNLGTSSKAWNNLYVKGTTKFNGRTYTWPSSAATAGQILQNNGSDTLTWVDAPVVVQEFRLSLTSGTSVTTSDVTAATTLYFTPHIGRRCTVFDASGNATTLKSAEISIAIPSTTSQMYDVFVFNNSGVLTLELLAWTNDTTRATAIVKTGGIDAAGIYTKSGDTTRRYVGSFRTTTVSGQTEDSLAKRYVWNYYNRVARLLRVVDATSTWTWTTDTWEQARAQAANQLDVVIGVAEVEIEVQVSAHVSNNNAGVFVYSGIGEDSTSATAAGCLIIVQTTPVANYIMALHPTLKKFPAIGRHTYVWLERSTATGISTWYGSYNGVSAMQSGIHGRIQG